MLQGTIFCWMEAGQAGKDIAPALFQPGDFFKHTNIQTMDILS